jgi:hypothetical protein
MSQQKSISHAKIREESDLSLEVVILLVFGLFASLFGWLLFGIHRGALPYSPDSLYGLFLVLVSIQTITLGKTPFGDLRRSWMVICIGIGTSVVGMTACFIPGPLTGWVRFLVGSLLAVGGISLLMQLFVSEEKARLWMKGPPILRHLTLAAALVYGLSVVSGLVTLLPGITTHPQTAILLILYGAGFFYLAWSIQQVGRQYPPDRSRKIAPGPLEPGRASRSASCSLFREVSLSLLPALLLLLAVLLTLLGVLLFPVNLGVLPFSPDGQLGLLVVLMAIQMMTMGETPVGQYPRSWLMILIGIGFAALGIFSCIVPGLLTGIIRTLLGVLNIGGNAVLLARRFLPLPRERKPPEVEAGAIPPILKKMLLIQTALNLVGILFGLSMLLPGFLPGLVNAGILVINGLLLFQLTYILHQLDEAVRDESRRDAKSGAATSLA